MKKIQLRIQQFSDSEILTRSQLKSVFGGNQDCAAPRCFTGSGYSIPNCPGNCTWDTDTTHSGFQTGVHCDTGNVHFHYSCTTTPPPQTTV